MEKTQDKIAKTFNLIMEILKKIPVGTKFVEEEIVIYVMSWMVMWLILFTLPQQTNGPKRSSSTGSRIQI